jgi:hypothetical protein
MSVCAHNELAMSLLERLSQMVDKSVAGVRSRKPVLTARDLDVYRQTRSLNVRDELEMTLTRVEQTGAIVLVWDEPGRSGMIQRIELGDATALATALGRTPHAELVASAAERVRASVAGTDLEGAPLWGQIFGEWERCQRVRGIGAGDADILPLAISAVLAARAMIVLGGVMIPLRALSRQLFNDSKQLEKLYSLVDLILLGDIDAEVRAPEEVWQELGLLKETQPMRLAGRIHVERGRLGGLIDAPYGAYDPERLQAVHGEILAVLSVENQTNFHALAREMAELPILLLYTAGMPSPAWCRAYRRLLASVPPETGILHWGDIDEGGFRIAARLAEETFATGFALQPFMMDPERIPASISADKAAAATVRLMAWHARRAGWESLIEQIEECRVTLEQEAFLMHAHGGADRIIQGLRELVLRTV